MEIDEVIGIDVSKLILDCCIHGSGLQKSFSNDSKGIDRMILWIFKNTKTAKEKVLFVFENTGLYSNLLTACLHEEGYILHVASGLEVKRSLGIARGKDDKADAKRIALYGYRIREEVRPHRMPSASLSSLKRLMSMRKKLVVQRGGHAATLKEQKRVLKGEKLLFEVQQELIAVLDQQIARIEKEIDIIIRKDSELAELHRLLMGIKGIGKVTARFLIVYTEGFTVFETWRKFASYCGIAPFPNRSGTSIRGRTKVSHLANNEGKSLLHLCATSAIQNNQEMMIYYQKRVKEGKSKMSTLNIIRNKLLARAFAVVKRGTPYVDTLKYAS